MALCWALDKLGPMCRTADDCGLVLSAIAGPDPLDASAMRKAFSYPAKDEKKYRIGVIKGSASPVLKPRSRRTSKPRFRCSQSSPTSWKTWSFQSFRMGPLSARSWMQKGQAHFAICWKAAGRLSCVPPAIAWAATPAWPSWPWTICRRCVSGRSFSRLFWDLYAKYDALVAPSRATVSMPIDKDFDKAYPGIRGGPAVIPAGNLAGQPAISVPNGFGAHQLPTGIQFTGRAWSESRLLAIAHAYQQATDWHRKRPPAI